MKWISFFFAILVAPSAQSLTVPEHYMSGEEICARYQSSRDGEFGFRVPVPVNYDNEDSIKTTIYAWTKKPLDREKPTVIFVNGGPGDSAHFSQLQLDRWNVVFFDQRGNSCSKPQTKDIYLSSAYYSSENTARDINEIRQFLDLPQVSIYGVGYGTVAAQIFASFFPYRTHALVLESVIFKSDEALQDTSFRRQKQQEFFQSLNPALQARILELSARKDLPKNWFSVAALMMLSQENGAEVFKSFLENTVWNEVSLTTTLGVFKSSNTEDTEFGFGDVTLGMIGCQELGMNQPELSLYSIFEKTNLIPDQANSFQKRYCQPLGFPLEFTNQTYSAEEYPVSVPVTYFQEFSSGGFDHLTLHAQKAALGSVQKVISKSSTLMPLQQMVENTATPALSWIHRSLLQQALEGQKLSADDITGLNQAAQTEWTLQTPVVPGVLP